MPRQAFKVHEGVFDEVAQFVEVPIVFAWDLLVAFWQDHDVGFACLGRGNDLIGVIATISEQIFSDGTCCNSDSHRYTMRIHGQMNLRIKPPLVRPMFLIVAARTCGMRVNLA
jgi:hypothetical protein